MLSAASSPGTTVVTSSRIVDGTYLANDPMMQYDGALFFNYNNVRIAQHDGSGNFYGIGVNYGNGIPAAFHTGSGSCDGTNCLTTTQAELYAYREHSTLSVSRR